MVLNHAGILTTGSGHSGRRIDAERIYWQDEWLVRLDEEGRAGYG